MPYARKRISVDVSEYEGELSIEDERDDEEETISIMSTREAIVKVTGKYTGRLYVFNGAGSILEMNKMDGEYLIQRFLPLPSCCGSYSTPYFQIVGR